MFGFSERKSMAEIYFLSSCLVNKSFSGTALKFAVDLNLIIIRQIPNLNNLQRINNTEEERKTVEKKAEIKPALKKAICSSLYYFFSN